MTAQESRKTVRRDLTTGVYIADMLAGTLGLTNTGTFVFKWSEDWFESKMFSPLCGVPSSSRETMTGPMIDRSFDRFYLPTSKINLQRMLQRNGLDARDLSNYNRRQLLFIKPYREFGIAFGAPCSHFEHHISTESRATAEVTS